MTEVADRTRALKAEKQVEQLERELQLLKSRIKVDSEGRRQLTLKLT